MATTTRRPRITKTDQIRSLLDQKGRMNYADFKAAWSESGTGNEPPNQNLFRYAVESWEKRQQASGNGRRRRSAQVGSKNGRRTGAKRMRKPAALAARPVAADTMGEYVAIEQGLDMLITRAMNLNPGLGEQLRAIRRTVGQTILTLNN